MWRTCLFLFCIVLSAFCGNYTYYDGFAHKATNQIIANQTIGTCVCQCLLTNGCSALTFYNQTATCSLVSDTIITEDDVSLNNTAKLLLISANLSYTP
ncbi:unnamed protein product [Rotaria sordida]|uniref:Apple domain-containing protein n=1 Tax=Rotaria sordida TaxID=392033 RepID=A0A813N4C7_9BILA|nr:unnamed protein product [Rotaria sordida]CAF0729278.1 unnamed protein product [Rotaria sordida]CAF0741987.1 unnamed protein product [Rotaria sordida]CAF0757565.1 unnamed protein product [Rotaria sordida]CAF0807818.1 unnamed protein product [Rotaria sordida]